MKNTTPTVEELRASVAGNGLPKHVAIIMDGNGRWQFADTVRGWSRRSAAPSGEGPDPYAFPMRTGSAPEEVGFHGHAWLLLRSEIETMKRTASGPTIGTTERLPDTVRTWIDRAMAETAGNTGMILNLALSYGGRGEIVEAIKRLSGAGGLTGDLTEEAFSSHLDTAGLPDPDLIIRTSGEKRISNFLLWQAAYAELYFTDILWPDFKADDLLRALLDYQGRQRRFGLTQEQLVRK
jgi:undecaprenyl diphosphate synthase